jgi:L-rhamnonate dehydratase
VRRPGQDKLKMVVAAAGAAADLAEDAARVRAVREAVGEGVQLMIDANQLLDPLRAAELCRLLEPLGSTWFEEPLHGDDALRLAELRQTTRIPIAAGQNEGHRWRHRELILGGAVDIVQPNVLSVGGYTEALKVAHLAQCFNLPVANGGGWPHHNAHLLAAVPNGWRVEFHLLMWHAGNAIYQDPPQPEAGWVSLPERPGLGLEPRQDALAEYRQEPAA